MTFLRLLLEAEFPTLMVFNLGTVEVEVEVEVVVGISLGA